MSKQVIAEREILTGSAAGSGQGKHDGAALRRGPRLETPGSGRGEDRAHDRLLQYRIVPGLPGLLGAGEAIGPPGRHRRRGGHGGSLIYAASGFRCPLTGVAQRLGSKHASVADIYLPRWLESHLPLITGPIFAGALVLHARNIIQSPETIS
ncbi:MAG: hypothetical protein ACM3ML_03320 [Micromonosporaceae bacterium]